MKCPLHVFNFSIKNQSDDSVDIHIDGDIVDASTQAILKSWFGDDTSVSFKSFRDQINSVDARTYNVYVNSGGGLVTDAMAMHDFLTELESKGKTVNRIGRGIIASSATYILMGKNSRMTKNSWFMIHNVSGAVWGDVDTVERYAVTLRKFNNRSRDFYTEFTGKRKEDITKMMNEETWMTADEAVEKGFVTSLVGSQNFRQKISNDAWQFSNMAVLNAYNKDVEEDAPDDDDKPVSQNQFNIYMKKFFQDIVNAIKGVTPGEKPEDVKNIPTQIADAVTAPFEKVADEIETTITNKVTEGLASDPVKNEIVTQVSNAVSAIDFSKEGPAKTALDAAVKVAVENATKDYAGKITALETAKTELEQKNKDLEKDITNLKGKKSISKEEEQETYVMKGRFN